jgi:hypothetical protein
MTTSAMKIATLVLCGSLGVVLAPACTIRIGPGTGEDGPSDPVNGTGEPEEPSDTGGGTLTPEEQAAFEALQNVDPAEFTMKTAATSYAAAACASLVESQVADPATVDEATVTQLFEEYAPIAFDEALAWMETADPSLIPLLVPEASCVLPPFSCPATVACSWGGEPVFCLATQCAEGPCPYCPWFSKLVYEYYCVYGCIRPGAGNKLVGGAMLFRTIFGNWDGPHCKYFGG